MREDAYGVLNLRDAVGKAAPNQHESSNPLLQQKEYLLQRT
jgi:hypothetical protein